MKKEKENQNEDKKESKINRILRIMKKKWLVQGTTTTILVLAIIAVFIAITVVLNKAEITPIDLSQEQLYTLSDEVKERIKNQNITQNVNIYFVGSSDDDGANLDLAKQFKDVNEHINVEAIDPKERVDIANKYQITDSSTQAIIVECGEKSKILTSSDLVTYDTSSGETISIADEKLATSIIAVTSEKEPKVYFLSTYSSVTLQSGMSYLSMLLQNEITQVDSFDILTTGKVPDDCDTLVITTPSKDFDAEAVNAIKDYIYQGKNILWFNAAIGQKQDLPNVNTLLAEYGVNPFEVGAIRETDASKMISSGTQAVPDIIKPDTMSSSPVTKNIVNTSGVYFMNPTKINLAESNKLEELKVTSTPLLQASEGAYFRTNFSVMTDAKTDSDQGGPFTVGAELSKIVKEGNKDENVPDTTSKLVIFGENNFITDISMFQGGQPMITYGYNKNLVLDSIAYLVDREEDISSRKSTGTVTYTATEQQNIIIMSIVFTLPVLIIIAGIVVWQIRRRKK